VSYTWTETYPPADYDFLWKFISVSDDGSVVLCPQWFDDVYVSEDSGSTWRHAKPNPDVVGYLWDDKNYSWWCGGVSGDGQHMVLGSQDSFDDKDGDPVPQLYLSHDRGVTWTAAYPLADCTGQAWYCACLDYDGSHLLVSDGSQAWVSVDSGASWTEALPGGASAAGVSCAIANDGATMYLAAARLWRSADSGSTWTELRPAGDQDTDFEFTACTAAGSKVFVGEYGGRLWLSTDSGTTWTEMKPDGSANKYWACGGMSRDGSVLWASHSTKTFISEDGGTTWRDATAEYPSTEVNILGLNADASNRFCAVGNDGRTGRIYHWTGSAWVEIQPHAPGFDRIWGEANSGLGDSASDTTGQIRLVCSTGGPGRVYLSRDYGETWTEARPLGDTGSYWQSVAVSRDGSVFMVGGINYLFISTDGVTWTRCRPGNPSYGQWMQMAIAQNGSSARRTAALPGRTYHPSSRGIAVSPATIRGRWCSRPLSAASGCPRTAGPVGR
jgi:photosystem II stability/assembly factor-like uncharacterized protein